MRGIVNGRTTADENEGLIMVLGVRRPGAGRARRWTPLRVVAGLTLAYSGAITVWPSVLAKPCRMLDEHGQVPPPVATLIRSTGTRDAALAAALLVAPPGPAVRLLCAARVVSDAADAVWFARLPVPAASRAKVAGAAAAWASVEALAYSLGSRR